MVNIIRQDKARNLLKEENKLKHKHNSTPSSMDNIVKPREVAQLFKNKFEMMYSSNPTTNDELRPKENTVNSRIKLCDQDQVSVVTVQNVKDAVSALKTRKFDGMTTYRYYKCSCQLLCDTVSSIFQYARTWICTRLTLTVYDSSNSKK